MWRYFSRDCPQDTLLLKERVEPGYGIVGCEMHERNGWGETAPSDHTWPLAYHYLRCPKCGYVNESRKNFDAAQEMRVACSRCSEQIVATQGQKG